MAEEGLTNRQRAVMMDTLRRMGYKPHSKLEAAYNGDALVVETKEYVLPTADPVPADTDDEGRAVMPWTHEGFAHRVWEFMRCDDEISVAEATVLTVREVIHEEERHEADEWIMLDGKQIFDPHDHDDSDKIRLRSLAQDYSSAKPT